VKFLSDLSDNPRAWQLLAVTALALELAALYFQYVLDLAPCIMCVYQRVALWSIFIGGVIGTIAAQNMIARIISYGFWAVGAIWGLIIAIEHVETQQSEFSFLFSCDIIPNFPSWAPLHEWIPQLFAATGDCGKISWEFLGYSMPQWMTIVFGVYTFVFAVIFLSRLAYKRAI